MAWNEPGGSGGKDPWGNRDSEQGPPDLDEVVRKMRERFGGLFGGRTGGGGERPTGGGAPGIAFLVVVGLLLWFLYDATYVIEPAERGVVLRFGEYATTLQPGLNVRLPRPIENVYRVNVEQVRTAAIGNTKAEALMLTQDENITDLKFTVQYQVKDARDYLFNIAGPEITLREVVESAVREIVGKSKMDFVITEGRDEVAARAATLVQEILDSYGAGLQVTQFNMQDAQPPEEVQDAFADAVKAREDEERFKNEAEAYARDVLGRAQGAAQRTVLDAQGYQSRVIESAQGESQRFSKLLVEYEKAPQVTRERLYIEAVEAVLNSSSKVMVDTKGGNNLLYLPLDRLMSQSGMGAGASTSGDAAFMPPPLPSGAPMQGDSGARDLGRLRTPGGR